MKKLALTQLNVRSFTTARLDVAQIIGGCSVNVTHRPLGCFASCPVMSDWDCGCFGMQDQETYIE